MLAMALDSLDMIGEDSYVHDDLQQFSEGCHRCT
jgi:hypothetical protein